MKKKLYLICPDCHLERVLSNEFGQDAFFLTALGSVFDFSAFDYAEALNQFIDRELIAEIILVNDTGCRFINNTICQANNYYTKAEQELKKLQKNNAEQFAFLATNQRKELLAKLNIYRQAYDLLDVAFVGGKIQDGLIGISGLLYNRDDSRFERLPLEL